MSRVPKVEMRLNGHLRDIASISVEGPELEQFASCITIGKKKRNELKYSTTSVAPNWCRNCPTTAQMDRISASMGGVHVVVDNLW